MVLKQKKDRVPLWARLQALWAGAFRDRVCAIVFAVIVGCVIWISLPPAFFRGIVVSFDVRAERYFLCSAYYRERGNGPLGRVNERVCSGESRVRFIIPAARVEWFRIDYGVSPGHVESSPVRVSGDKDEVLEWRNFNAFNDIQKRAILPDGWLSLESEGSDPYIAFGKKLDVRSGWHFNPNGIVMRILLLIVMAVGLFWRARLVVSVRATVFRKFVCPVSVWFDAICRKAYDGFRLLLPNRSFAIYMVVIILLAWGFELFNFTFTSDDDVVLYGGFPLNTWLKEGRWGMFLLDEFYGNNSVPLFPLAITLFLYSMTFVLIFDRLGRSKYFLFPVYVAFPVIYQSFSFTSLNPGIGIAFFLAALAVRFSEGGIASWCASVLFASVSIGCYQIFVFFMVIVVVIRCMDRVYAAQRVDMRELAVSVIRGFCMIVLAYLVYKAIMYGFTHVTGVGETYVTKRYFDPPCTLDDLRAWWPLALKRIAALLSGSLNVFPTPAQSFPVLLVLGWGAIAAWTVFGRRPLFVRLVVFFGCLSLMVLAFLPLAFNRRAMILDRIIVPLIPVALVGVLSYSARCLLRFRFALLSGAGLCVLCSFQFIWNINQMVYSNCLQNRHDSSFLSMVKSRVETLPQVAMRRFRGIDVPLLIIGRNEYDRRGAVVRARKAVRWPEWERDNVGRSLLVEPSRWRFAMKTYLGASYAPTDSSRISKSTMSFIESMPVWPLAGSVAWKDGYAIVKFSDFAPQHVSDSRRLPRKLCLCRDVRYNGFDELAFTDVDESNLLHRYGNGGVLASDPKRASLTLPPFRTAEPYLILEFRTEVEQNSMLTLWNGHARQECQFVLSKGKDVLRLRVPAEFLTIPLRLDLSSSAAVKILGVTVYADKKYTKRLFELNPQLKDSLGG